MNSEQFDKILESRLEATRAVLAAKRKEYAQNGGDRLHNFNRAASMLDIPGVKRCLVCGRNMSCR